MIKKKDLSRALDKDIKKEKKVIRYRLAGIKKEDIPGNNRTELVPLYKNVPAFDRVVRNDNDYNIGFVRRTRSDGTVQFGSIVFSASNFGWINIDPKTANAEQRDLYNYMENSDYNGSNEERDKSKPVFFYRVDDEKQAQKSLDFIKLKLKAQNMVMDITEKQLSNLEAVLGLPETKGKDPIVQRDLIVGYASKVPDVVIQVIESEDAEVEALLKAASKHNILSLDKKKGAFSYQGEEIYKASKTIGAQFYKELAEYLKLEDPDLIETIKKRVEMVNSEEFKKQGEQNKSTEG